MFYWKRLSCNTQFKSVLKLCYLLLAFCLSEISFCCLHSNTTRAISSYIEFLFVVAIKIFIVLKNVNMWYRLSHLTGLWDKFCKTLFTASPSHPYHPLLLIFHRGSCHFPQRCHLTRYSDTYSPAFIRAKISLANTNSYLVEAFAAWWIREKEFTSLLIFSGTLCLSKLRVLPHLHSS